MLGWTDGRTASAAGFTCGNPGGRRYYGKDTIALDDMMAHGMVAAVTYAYYLNRLKRSPSGVDYNERFTFWIRYLRDDFERKWRVRSGRQQSFPFVHHTLTHPNVGILRYYEYMSRMGFPDTPNRQRNLPRLWSVTSERWRRPGAPRTYMTMACRARSGWLRRTMHAIRCRCWWSWA